MSVKLSFLMLTMLTFLVLIGVGSLNWISERQNVNTMAEQNAKEIVQGFKQLLVLKSDPFKKQAMDYGAWNDLASFTQSKNKQWADDNLVGSMIQFGINGFYILDESKKVIFSEFNRPYLKNIDTLFPVALLDPFNPNVLHFFTTTSQYITEFFVAPIHRVDEKIDHTSLSKGFVVIAKQWDEAFLKDLSGYGIAEASLHAIENNKSDYMIEHEIPLLGIQGEKVGVLHLNIHNRMGEVLDNYGLKSLKLAFINTFILMFVFLLLISKFISFPLRDITFALNIKSKEPLKKYLSKNNEYGAIATALSESFDTKNELEFLNTNLEQKIRKEVESSRLKDRMLFQQAKFAALGEMLGNIAHQWRQPLNTFSVVINKIYLDSKMNKLTPQTVENEIKKLRILIQDMSGTIDDFKDFFQIDTEKVIFFLYKCIEDSIRITDGGMANKNIVFQVDCPQTIMMRGFKKELSQVLLVLFNNAKEVIIERHVSQGEISIKVYEQEHYIILEISDNGGGMNDVQLPYIFDPFFSTKDPKRGNGVGLYMSKQIIEQSLHGTISVCNEHKGLFFTIVLPKENV